MNGRGLTLDNVVVASLWHSIKWKELYLRDYLMAPNAIHGLTKHFVFYNTEVPRRSFNQTPQEFYDLCKSERLCIGGQRFGAA
jgi:putative transposase